MRRNSAKIIIVGTGYVGLTTGVCLAYLGNNVACVDTNPDTIRQLRQGQVTIDEPGISDLIQKSPDLYFTTSLEEVMPSADTVIIAVGTPSRPDGSSDISQLEAVAKAIGTNMTADKKLLIVNKSTVPIGSARRVQTIVDHMLQLRGLECEYSVASNPEFLREGAAVVNTLYPDRIVVGSDSVEAVNRLLQLYSPIVNQTFTPPVHAPRPQNYNPPAFVTTNPASAELIKYAANAFLSTKITFINEFAGLAEKVGADIKEVALGIGLDQRIGTRYLEAGIGWGGSCFGKDLKSIVSDASHYGYPMPLLEATLKSNYRQRLVVIDKLQETLKIVRGSTIGIMGLAFKPDTSDLRDAPSLDIIVKLLDLGARIKVYDPMAIANFQQQNPTLDVEYCTDVPSLSKDCDALLLVTEWREFSALNWADIGKEMRQKVFIDGRNMFESSTLEDQGFTYRGIGKS
jgi:UDPglucose 6-dehydrogenase